MLGPDSFSYSEFFLSKDGAKLRIITQPAEIYTENINGT
jgi:hypothetical protein